MRFVAIALLLTATACPGRRGHHGDDDDDADGGADGDADADADADGDADADTATLTAQWRFADGLGCATQEGAPDQIEAVLYSNNSLHDTQTVPCPTAQVLFADLPPGDNYDLQVTALSALSEPLYRYQSLDIVLAPGDTETVDEVLLPCTEIQGNCQ